jgi:hypothetical protein
LLFSCLSICIGTRRAVIYSPYWPKCKSNFHAIHPCTPNPKMLHRQDLCPHRMSPNHFQEDLPHLLKRSQVAQYCPLSLRLLANQIYSTGCNPMVQHTRHRQYNMSVRFTLSIFRIYQCFVSITSLHRPIFSILDHPNTAVLHSRV